MNVFKTLALGAGLSGLLLSAAYAEGLQGKVIGFSQIGSESGWRAAETSVTKQVAAELGIAAPRIVADPDDCDAALDAIRDGELEEAARDAYQRDYMGFGFFAKR